MTVQLRPYQVRAEDAVFGAFDAGIDRPMISIPTGGGKSVIFGSITNKHHSHHRKTGPTVLLAHRKELIDQAAEHFARAMPAGTRIEKVIGSPGRVGSTAYLQAKYRWKQMDVLVTSPQTLNSDNTMRIFPDPSLVIADEAHHYASAMFRRVLTKLGCFSGTKLLGVTATPFREDYRSLDDIFQAVVANIDIGWLITHKDDGAGGEIQCAPGEGYLVPPRLRHLTVDGLDLSDVPTSRLSGTVDYREAELAEAMESAGAFDMVAKTIASELAERKGAVFCPTVASSKHLAQIMNDLGLATGHLDGTMDKTTRARLDADFRAGRIRWLCNVGIISEGYDLPDIDTVVLARPTRSRIFFRQAVGRALRPAPGKDHAVILDVAGASDGHSLAGVEALTDSDVLTARDNEQLTELLERSDRARRGLCDRIAGHAENLRERQTVGEHAFEQIKLTAEGFAKALPGLEQFVSRAEPLISTLLDTTTEGIDLTSTAVVPPRKNMDDLAAIEQRAADMATRASREYAGLEQLKTLLRGALIALKEEPAGEVAKALVTGYVGTVRGTLFGEEEQRADPKKPASAQALKLRGAAKAPKRVFEGRRGWALCSSKDHHFAPLHGEKEVTGLAIAVKIETSWWPVIWTQSDGVIDNITDAPLASHEDAHQTIVDYAADHTGNQAFLNPSARWRKNPASGGARSMMHRVARGWLSKNGPIPDDATAGLVADVITYAQFDKVVNGIAAQVASTVTR